MILKMNYFVLIVLIASTVIRSQMGYHPPSDVGPVNVSLKMGGGLATFIGTDAKGLINSYDLLMNLCFVPDFLCFKNFEFPQEVGIEFKGTRYEIIDFYGGTIIDRTTRSVELFYAQINTMLKYKFITDDSTPFIGGGFYLSFLIHGADGLEKFSPKVPKTVNSYDANNLDYGLFFGAGYDFGIPNKGRFQRSVGMELRYSLGLQSVYLEQFGKKPELKNQTITLLFRLYLLHL